MPVVSSTRAGGGDELVRKFIKVKRGEPRKFGYLGRGKGRARGVVFSLGGGGGSRFLWREVSQRRVHTGKSSCLNSVFASAIVSVGSDTKEAPQDCLACVQEELHVFRACNLALLLKLDSEKHCRRLFVCAQVLERVAGRAVSPRLPRVRRVRAASRLPDL